MLTAVITGPDLFSAKRQIKNAKEADAIEIRLDCLDAIDLVKIAKLQKYWNKTIIFSLRRSSHGGKYYQHDKKLYFDLKRLFSLNPTYFDLEYDLSLEFIKDMKSLYPEVKIITSYHNFDKLPENLNEVLQKLKNPHATFYKIAANTKNVSEALRLLKFLKDNPNENLIIVPLGEKGSFLRVISKIYGNKITYAYVDKKNVLGQISIDDLTSVYNFKKINSSTEIYALLGSDLKNSLSHVVHNSMFLKNNKNAVYVKIELQPHELLVFRSFLKEFPFKGFSVTMPLKEKILTFIDEDQSKVQSINTVILQNNKFVGFNTDGIAALDSIERKMKVENKRVFLIGAGGVGKAIAFEAIKRKANLSIFNRDQIKAFDLATRLQCKSFPLENLKDIMLEGYDILINATSTALYNKDIVPYECLIPNTIVMDVVAKPVETPLLKQAQEKKCVVIYGMEMFLNQAKMQFQNV